MAVKKAKWPSHRPSLALTVKAAVPRPPAKVPSLELVAKAGFPRPPAKAPIGGGALRPRALAVPPWLQHLGPPAQAPPPRLQPRSSALELVEALNANAGFPRPPAQAPPLELVPEALQAKAAGPRPPAQAPPLGVFIKARLALRRQQQAP